MFVVIFEVQPKKLLFEEYLDLAKVLKPELEKIDGFIDNERFASRRVEGRILSLSTWRDEKALIRWRTLAIHHKVQEKGRFHVFEDYHLRVGEVTADTNVPEGQMLRTQRFDPTEIGEAKAVTISELASRTGAKPVGQDHAAELQLRSVGRDGVVDQEAFDSIYNPGRSLVLTYWLSEVAATRWEPCAAGSSTLRHRRVRIIRDYGMTDRREAPQYYPPVQPAVDSP
jgi:heme-degrading monooxygenase HmoA